ncbi:MAG: Holliday junction resolvase RuvX [Gammaproteobacteria bacterium]|nr:Holliday junction resolvase RuvX [Gammaproteobacteria bacterium]
MGIRQILGLDFGLFKTGLAIGQTITRTASPIGILKMRKGQIDLPSFKKIMQDWKPDAMVIGIPVKMDESAFNISHQAEACAKWLEVTTGLPVFRVDERLTTKAARSELLDMKSSGIKQTKTVDAYAAVLILESWLREYV